MTSSLSKMLLWPNEGFSVKAGGVFFFKGNDTHCANIVSCLLMCVGLGMSNPN